MKHSTPLNDRHGMKNIRLIRHGESAANAGAASRNHASIALTEKGIEQARQVAQSIVRAPQLMPVHLGA